MDPITQYHQVITEVLAKIATEQREPMEKAARIIADSIAEGRIFHIFGTGGHSNMAAIEFCHRAGNLVPCNAILDAGIGVEHGATRWIERVVGYAKQVLDYYRVKPGDVMVLVNAYGMNSVTIDAALECRERGVTVIAVTSPELSLAVPPSLPSRHPSKKNLFELADVVINSYTPFGEAVVDIEGFAAKVSPISTISNLFILNSINAKVSDILAKRGITPPVWISGNIPGGDEANRNYLEQYFGKIRHL